MPSCIRSLVIGGAGFIGSALCRKLLEFGHCVICLDDLSTGKLDNLTDICDERFVFRTRDLLTLEPCEVTSKLDYIWLLACPASPKKYRDSPVRTLNICFNGTLKALHIARETGARLIFTSTSEIYGDPLEHPQTEGYNGNVNTIGPRACYDEGKRVAETLIMEYAKEHNVKYSIARVFNTYSPYMSHDDGRVISTFIHQAQTGQDVTVYGDGQQTRSFCYVDDLVEGLISLATHEISGPVNLGNDNEITILELAQLIISKFGNGNIIRHCDLPEDDPTRRCPDISLAYKLMGWQPKISLDEGLDRLQCATPASSPVAGNTLHP